jgi:hypothetical protein
MKLAGKFSPLHRQAFFLATFLILSGGVFSRVQASDNLPPVKEQLQPENCKDIAHEVYRQVAENSKKAEDIIAIAVKDHPKCASAIIKQGIAALSPGKHINGVTDPKEVIDPKDEGSDPPVDPRLVDSILSTVLNYVKGDPELMDTIIQTFLEIDPSIKSDIPKILAGIFIDPLVTGNPSQGTLNFVAVTPDGFK